MNTPSPPPFARHPLAITMGDPNGIGPELCVKLFAEGVEAPVFVIGDAGVLQKEIDQLGLKLSLNRIDQPSESLFQPQLMNVLSVTALGEAFRPGAIEARAGQRTWDIAQTANVQKFPQDFLADFEPIDAQKLMPSARGAKNKWFGMYANYNAPAYNTNLVKPDQIPQKLEDFIKFPQFAGRIVIDDTDTPWLAAIFDHYGEKRAREILEEFVTKMKPVVLDGHLAIARAVGTRRSGQSLFFTANQLASCCD